MSKWNASIGIAAATLLAGAAYGTSFAAARRDAVRPATTRATAGLVAPARAVVVGELEIPPPNLLPSDPALRERPSHGALEKVWPRLTLPDLPFRDDPRIVRAVLALTADPKGRALFASALRRSGRYREIIARQLRAQRLPEDLIAVAFLESAFLPRAVSRAGAVGLWQLMPETARACGLTVTGGFDERVNPWRSTEGATRMLADLHQDFYSWELALAAYNMGPTALRERIHDTGVEDFWALGALPKVLPRETQHYVPNLLAIALVLRNLDAFGFQSVRLLPPVDESKLGVPAGTRLSLVARAAGTSVRALRELNPELAGDVVPVTVDPLSLHVPDRGLSRARTLLPFLLDDGDPEERPVSEAFDWGHDE